MLTAAQLRILARIARDYDRGYGHFTTRQNIQYNWIDLAAAPTSSPSWRPSRCTPSRPAAIASATSTTDHLAGVAADERIDPRPYCELMRQWSTFNPEFAYLPRKFKVAFNGAADDRAATGVHDLASNCATTRRARVVMDVAAGGGQAPPPRIAPVIKRGLPWREMLTPTRGGTARL